MEQERAELERLEQYLNNHPLAIFTHTPTHPQRHPRAMIPPVIPHHESVNIFRNLPSLNIINELFRTDSVIPSPAQSFPAVSHLKTVAVISHARLKH